MDTIKINKGSSLMVAHGTLQGLEPPNTLAGVIAAANRSTLMPRFQWEHRLSVHRR